MALGNLIVLNRRTPDGAASGLLPTGLVLGTCLREVRIAAIDAAAQPSTAEADAAGEPPVWASGPSLRSRPRWGS